MSTHSVWWETCVQSFAWYKWMWSWVYFEEWSGNYSTAAMFPTCATSWLFRQCTQNLPAVSLWSLSVLHSWVTRPCQWVGGSDSCKAEEEEEEETESSMRVFCHCQTLFSLLAVGTMIYGGVSLLVRTWAGSLAFCRKRGGESTLLCPWCFSNTPILALLISISVYSYDGL